MDKIILQSNNLHIEYGQKVIIKNISFRLKTNEAIILMGMSACGKTSFLKALAGIIPYKGEIIRHGRIMMMFQRPCVLPHKTAISNINYVKKICNAKEKFTNELIERLGVNDLLNQYPHQLSGGQLQRLSLLTCLLARPRILLLDEPFSALDYTTRYNMITLLKDIKEREGLSYLIVTHTLDEIDAVGNKYLYMNGNPAILEEFMSIKELKNTLHKIH